MNREDLMRISRSLALFRPSFLALIMNLTEDDLVFMEQCIQRTLLVRVGICGSWKKMEIVVLT